MASYRHLARVAVMQTLFAYEFRGGLIEPDLKSNLRDYGDKLIDDPYPKETLEGILKHQEEIRKVIQEMAPEWPIERIAGVDRAILEIGVYELLFNDTIPPLVAINEAIELAKSYGDTNTRVFVNGVLSSVLIKIKKINPSDEKNLPIKSAKKAKKSV